MRKYFRPLESVTSFSNLIEVQLKSYLWLFEEGLGELLNEVSPVEDFTGKVFSLEFGEYSLDKPKYDEKTAKDKNLTFKAPLRCKVKLVNKLTNKSKTGEVFLGDFPLMTERGTFIINGVERVVVSQIVRSFGIFFVSEEIGARRLFGAKVIPNRGAWLEFETNSRDVISVKVDRKRRIPATTFLRALGKYDDAKIKSLFKDIDTNPDHHYIDATLARDPAKTQEEAVVEVYKRIRPGDLVTPETAETFIQTIFFNSKRYDLGRVGRYKINQRLEMNLPNNATNRVLRVEDIVSTIREIIRLNNTPGAEQDDVDHLKNRRVKAVGELVQNRLRVGLLRMERIIKDRMSQIVDPEEVNPVTLVNSRPVAAILQEFFASSQMSQFMNQTNPLAELEHKRTLSATGPGGLSREHAGFDVRDVHRSHYGRICPITTPEGQNIGLVGYLATSARVNEYGFIETPFRKIEHKDNKARVTEKVEYLDAYEEEKYTLAPYSAKVDDKGYVIGSRIIARRGGDPVVEATGKVDYIDISPQQIGAIAVALIPFVEHDDAVRASMGSNMQRQAVPLVRSEAPIIGTGLEGSVKDSGQLIVAEEDGEVSYVDAAKIVLKTKRGEKTYDLLKFSRSNQSTCINQRPIVEIGQKVKIGDVIADSSASDQGELAIGQNVTVAYMSWGGYNYEDAIIVSERLVKDDRYTSIHIEKYSAEVRDTKLGPELVTRDIPNVGDEALANLDEQGIVRIGAEVSAGDILVGKITPKGETELTAEEKLLRAIFGEKAKDVKDTSLRLPHGEYGKVVAVKIFSKEQGDELPAGVYQQIEVSVAQMRKVTVGDKMAGRHGNKGVISRVVPEEDMPFLPDGTPVDIILNPLGVISRMNLGQILETHLGWAAKKLGYRVASPAFHGVPVAEIEKELAKADLPVSGKIQLRNGRDGNDYDQETTVGIKYLLKLIHLVDDKMHARSTGPYSMVTQQPLGGKAQFGGQRFGEMEVWALEAYGAAHTLQEMLTIKSDDVIGRAKAYEAIIKGETIQKPQIPASFAVLVRELESLGLNVEVIETEEKMNEITEEQSLLEDQGLPEGKLRITDPLGEDADEMVRDTAARQTAIDESPEEQEVLTRKSASKASKERKED
ncbi:MAG: DNA-directed RNA polymerase subunit beta [Candidatus Berkelbacteria bacterium]|nr:MAG: DNA-directed RNA polymerase subunit beta [Candidatus Berkelbacteria bacterium]QQG52151.1 MAG: DNA-directed RNA polymerase subunit beta [Candidatus Berkelbacteria bacterium]